jgi:hypothetical protein
MTRLIQGDPHQWSEKTRSRPNHAGQRVPDEPDRTSVGLFDGRTAVA